MKTCQHILCAKMFGMEEKVAWVVKGNWLQIMPMALK